MNRMVIRGVLPPEKPPADGLPPLPPMPPRDGVYEWRFVGRKAHADAWGIETVQQLMRTYGRTCAAALDVEIDVLKAERDALRAEVERLRELTT